MLYQFALVAAVAVGHAVAQIAPESTGNPSGITYTAALPKTPSIEGADHKKGAKGAKGSVKDLVKGTLSAKAGPKGKGVRFDVHFENLPAEGGPFRKSQPPFPFYAARMLLHASASRPASISQS